MPLRLAAHGEEGRNWRCAGCGATFYGVLADGSAPKVRRNVEFVATESSSRDNLAAAGFKPRGTAKTARPASIRTQCPVHTPLSRVLDSAIEQGAALRMGPQGPPFAERKRKVIAAPYEKHRINQFVQSVGESLDQIDEILANLNRKALPRLEAIESITEMALGSVAEDMDLFVSLAINPPHDSYPSRHSLHVAMLAMSIGCTMGWDERTLMDLGLGCLIHDAGMYELPDHSVQQSRVLSTDEHLEIVQHPLRTFDLIERKLDLVPPRSRMVAYQMHERCNGEGYPRGRKSHQIHPLARAAAVADVFVAIVSPRPHRPGILPYYAVKHLLYGVKEGLFDPDVVRALLGTVSLFPLGSRVLLNDGRCGSVIRSNGQLYDRPVVELVSPIDQEAERTVIDLSRQTDLRVQDTLGDDA